MKNYYFVFCKGDIMLEKLPDGKCTIPCQKLPPTDIKQWTNVMNVTPLVADGHKGRPCKGLIHFRNLSLRSTVWSYRRRWRTTGPQCLPDHRRWPPAFGLLR